MNKSINLLGLTRQELFNSLNLHYPSIKNYNVEQIWNWIYVKGQTNINEMNNLSRDLREKVHPHFFIDYGNEKEGMTSIDGTIKKLLEYPNKATVETVLIPETGRRTICLSSQVGCSLACSFCHTGTQKLLRNLTSTEIIGQYMCFAKLLKEFPINPLNKRKINNIVFMGQGEPLYNHRNVFKAIKILTDAKGLNFPKNKIVVSTSGIAPMIPKLAEDLGVGLAISLHAVNDDLRNELVPINKTYNMKALLEACDQYIQLSNPVNRRITFEYVMLKKVNDSIKEAHALVRLLSRFPAHVNLIPFNPWPGSQYECSDMEDIHKFANILSQHKLQTTIRFPRGKDIMAACGQLKSMLENKESKSN